MKIESRQIQIKDKKIILRSCSYDDAYEFLDFFKQVSGESENMVRYPEEINIAPEKEAQILERIANSYDQWSIGLFNGKELIGNINFGCVGNRIKIKHRASFGITIKKDYWNLGLGTLLISEMLEILNDKGYEQVELEVLASNASAIHLYEKMGFKECGRIPHGIKLKNGEYVDLISMNKFLY